MIGSSDPFSMHGFGASVPWLDLVNSELYDGFGHFTECLEDRRWVRSFLRFWKLRIPAGSPEAINALRALRSVLRRLVEKNAAGTLSAGDLIALNAWLKVPVIPELVESQSGFALELRAAQIGWPSEVAAIARSFAEALIREPGRRLKTCANDECRWVFVDRTKGNVRRWCNDKTCGNRDRVRRARAKGSR